MNKVLIFVSGAVIGAASSFLYLRRTYSKKYDAAIEYYYSHTPGAETEVEVHESVNEKPKKDNDIQAADSEFGQITNTGIVKKNYNDMKSIITENKYAGKEETSEDCMSDSFIKKAAEVINDIAPEVPVISDRPHRISENEVETYIAKGYETLDLTFYEDMVLAETRSHEAIEEPSTMIGYENYRHLMDHDGDLYVVDDEKSMLYFIDHSDEQFEEIF